LHNNTKTYIIIIIIITTIVIMILILWKVYKTVYSYRMILTRSHIDTVFGIRNFVWSRTGSCFSEWYLSMITYSTKEKHVKDISST